MQEITVNGKDFDTPEEVYEFLAEKLELPGESDGNLSALYDVLLNLSDDIRLILNLTEVEDDAMMEILERIAEILTDAADTSEYLEVSIKQ
ncbi:barstar family protein [Blautia sp. HCP3S3_G3]|uniref:barstar family protein n=1 Tax=Blautia sp. HCP3S3_G3 TaxID=3438913 RepID=UPI003F8A170C